MSGTVVNAFEILLIEENRRLHHTFSIHRKEYLTIRSLWSGCEVLTLRRAGSKLQISSQYTWTLGSHLAWSGGSFELPVWERKSI